MVDTAASLRPALAGRLAATVGNSGEADSALSPAPYWDRFAHWPRNRARLALFLVALLFALSAIVPISRGRGADTVPQFGSVTVSDPSARDDDLSVYDNVLVRLKRGESYYPAVAAEHREIGFPLTPGLAVRLPTLAWFYAAIGETGERAFAILLFLGVLIVWWRRLGELPETAAQRPLCMALIGIGAVLVLNVYYYRLHELPSGMLLAIGFGLWRPGKWFPAILPIAAALAIREHSLPFVALLGAMAIWRRDWREAAVWTALGAAFIAGLALHLHLVAEQARAGDLVSQSWLAMRGLSGWLEAMIFPTNLRYLPHYIAGPVVVAMLLGWAGWRGPVGTFGFLLLAGYGFAFTIAGRDENYYWGLMVTPLLALGLAFAPMAAKGLLRAAIAR
ncbi:MAG: hypothetical protein ACK4NZ_11765 [Tsuneonella sp.]